ncbi:uncharacterized protein LOC130029431 [Sorex fumeus]|uniref:uncharacterized protein LOC130029431 n=1 Tax=Sorex fumeus TaxID=62283 RepID=UPI0024ADE258|nr:uncharacterized protein LOC130029431 [Sorex fumeus]
MCGESGPGTRALTARGPRARSPCPSRWRREETRGAGRRQSRRRRLLLPSRPGHAGVGARGRLPAGQSRGALRGAPGAADPERGERGRHPASAPPPCALGVPGRPLRRGREARADSRVPGRPGIPLPPRADEKGERRWGGVGVRRPRAAAPRASEVARTPGCAAVHAGAARGDTPHRAASRPGCQVGGLRRRPVPQKRQARRSAGSTAPQEFLSSARLPGLLNPAPAARRARGASPRAWEVRTHLPAPPRPARKFAERLKATHPLAMLGTFWRVCAPRYRELIEFPEGCSLVSPDCAFLPPSPLVSGKKRIHGFFVFVKIVKIHKTESHTEKHPVPPDLQVTRRLQ